MKTALFLLCLVFSLSGCSALHSSILEKPVTAALTTGAGVLTKALL